jgi:hypothetical protein
LIFAMIFSLLSMSATAVAAAPTPARCSAPARGAFRGCGRARGSNTRGRSAPAPRCPPERRRKRCGSSQVRSAQSADCPFARLRIGIWRLEIAPVRQFRAIATFGARCLRNGWTQRNSNVVRPGDARHRGTMRWFHTGLPIPRELKLYQ